MLKKSKYNYCVEKENEVYIYNFLYRTFLRVNKEAWENGKFSGNEEIALIRYGILLSESINEYEVFKNIVYKNLYSSKSKMIFLSMTSQCNFNCSYCYQDCRKDVEDELFIEKENVDVLYTYLEKCVNENKLEKLGIVFFGGEPTLNEEKLVYAIEKLNSLKGVDKTFSIITNGYLLGDKLMETIKYIDNFMVQITLDGYGKYHDINRPLKDGTPTFDQIYNNIKKIGRDKIANLVVRVNVDLSKTDYYYEMIDKLAEDDANKIVHQLGFEAIFDGQKKRNCNHARENKEICMLNQYAREMGFHVSYNVISGPCMTHSASDFAIDENLRIYNCPGSLYKKNTAHINDNGDFIVDDGEWYHDILYTKECTKTCPYAPICYGGCTMNNSCNKEQIVNMLPYFIEDKIQNYKDRSEKENL